MPFLIQSPKLKDIQEYVSELEKERGFDHQDVLQKCLLLGEEEINKTRTWKAD